MSPRSPSPRSNTGWSAWTSMGESSDRRCSGTTPARRRRRPSSSRSSAARSRVDGRGPRRWEASPSRRSRSRSCGGLPHTNRRTPQGQYRYAFRTTGSPGNSAAPSRGESSEQTPSPQTEATPAAPATSRPPRVSTASISLTAPSDEGWKSPECSIPHKVPAIPRRARRWVAARGTTQPLRSVFSHCRETSSCRSGPRAPSSPCLTTPRQTRPG